MGLGAKISDAATAGLTGAITGGIGSIISGGLGLLGGLFKKNNNGLKNQQKLMQQAWEYEKEGMGLQYNYGQQAADAEYKRNLQMWKDTNFGAQRAEIENAGLSVGLMYGNGGGQAASTAGGDATQPNAPKTNPVEVALQQNRSRSKENCRSRFQKRRGKHRKSYPSNKQRKDKERSYTGKHQIPRRNGGAIVTGKQIGRAHV